MKKKHYYMQFDIIVFMIVILLPHSSGSIFLQSAMYKRIFGFITCIEKKIKLTNEYFSPL
jgi:hypothetical protein